MAKILGLDLGTNSIGWAIRETEEQENQIIDNGVIIFQKGVGDGKSGEFSLAAERRKNRGKRRLYNAKRYRKWELLKVLIENEMCPLTMEELRLWSVGNLKENIEKYKNKRIYPIENKKFQDWLAFDPAIFGEKGKSENEKPIRKNPYDLRYELIEKEDENEYVKKLKIGRALYHLVQRRGFKSSRKSGQSAYAKNEDIEKLKEENPDFQISFLAKEKLDKGKRFRASGVIQRKYFEDEFFAICNKQKLGKELTEKLHKAIYFVRPLRSQKGLVGNCTIEKDKPRIPISHPKFEEFRALQFINNIKWREKNQKEFVEIPISLKKEIFEELFFKKLISGKNKGKVTTENYFKFEEIIKNYSRNGEYEFNYKNLPNVSTCPTIAALMNVFHDEWKDKFIQDKNTYGINWEGLSINYSVKYGNKAEQKRNLKVDEIWHLLFDYIQTKDKEEDLEKFCQEVLGFDENKAKSFAEIDIPQGYGSLSYKAISKILPFLQSGFIYSEAVLFANLKKVLGENFEKDKEQAKLLIATTIKEIGARKEVLNLVNGLIKQFFGENEFPKVVGLDEEICYKAYKAECENYLEQYNNTEEEKKQIWELYAKFLNGDQTIDETASGKSTLDYYKLPRLDEAIKQCLKDNFKVSDKDLKHLYHPSDIEMYPVSRCEYKDTNIKLLESPQPPSNGWKNPMAMRTLHELRHLLNYLLKIGKIDKSTKVVVEMARELNDANKRKAIKAWQDDREKENKEYASAIAELYDISMPSENDYNLFKVAVEQLVEKDIPKDFKKKHDDFINTFLIKKTDNSKGQSNDKEEKETEIVSTDYLMYLILTRDEFTKLLLDQPAGTGKILNLAKDFQNKRNAIKEMLTKYRLWKEQEFQCFYTGQKIPFSQLFTNNYQIEHTIPRSISFDSELKNLTVCDATYNSQEKNNKFPTECPNYNISKNCKTVNGTKLCPPISASVDRMIKPKVDELTQRIKNLTVAAKKIKSWETDKKNANIRLRHYLQFELDYWEKKLLTFTIKKEDWKDKWKNSQLVDTQIISKYARAYLKTVFEKVDVQKGTIVNDFKKIYQIKGDEQKDRSKHSHHAVDAAILTLIPSSAKREAILEKYYKAEENYQKFYAKPYETYKTSHLLDIENNVIINHIPHDKTLTATIKNIRKRGEKTGWVAQGDSIRGQLHKETFFGAVKALERNEQGFPIKENGKYKTVKNKDGEDEIWIVSRKPIKDIKIDKDIIVDELLKQYIQKQLDSGVELSNVVDFNNKPIRHIRIRVKAGMGVLKTEKAKHIKKQTYLSKHSHKQNYLAQNETNYLFLLYEGVDCNNKMIVDYKILNLLDIAQLGIKSIRQIKADNAFQKMNIKTKGNDIELYLKVILKAGDKVIFYKESRDEITIENVCERIYRLFKFDDAGTTYLYFQHLMEARPDKDLNEDINFDVSKYQPRLKLGIGKLNCLFEGKDFEIKPDGKIIFN